jgi:hypothetical protein
VTRCRSTGPGAPRAAPRSSAPVKDPSKLPSHLVADEKHTWLEGEKVYVATTAAGGSILGAELAESASTEALELAGTVDFLRRTGYWILKPVIFSTSSVG